MRNRRVAIDTSLLAAFIGAVTVSIGLRKSNGRLRPSIAIGW